MEKKRLSEKEDYIESQGIHFANKWLTISKHTIINKVVQYQQEILRFTIPSHHITSHHIILPLKNWPFYTILISSLWHVSLTCICWALQMKLIHCCTKEVLLTMTRNHNIPKYVIWSRRLHRGISFFNRRRKTSLGSFGNSASCPLQPAPTTENFFTGNFSLLCRAWNVIYLQKTAKQRQSSLLCSYSES